MNALNEVLRRIDERIGECRKTGAHPQYIEGLRDTLDIIRDVLE